MAVITRELKSASSAEFGQFLDRYLDELSASSDNLMKSTTIITVISFINELIQHASAPSSAPSAAKPGITASAISQSGSGSSIQHGQQGSGQFGSDSTWAVARIARIANQ